MVSVPDRALPLFEATDAVTVPLPVPGDPAAIDRKPAFATAVHAQPVPCVVATANVVMPPAYPTCRDVGVTLYVHERGAPSCVIAMV